MDRVAMAAWLFALRRLDWASRRCRCHRGAWPDLHRRVRDRIARRVDDLRRGGPGRQTRPSETSCARGSWWCCRGPRSSCDRRTHRAGAARERIGIGVLVRHRDGAARSPSPCGGSVDRESSWCRRSACRPSGCSAGGVSSDGRYRSCRRRVRSPHAATSGTAARRDRTESHLPPREHHGEHPKHPRCDRSANRRLKRRRPLFPGGEHRGSDSRGAMAMMAPPPPRPGLRAVCAGRAGRVAGMSSLGVETRGRRGSRARDSWPAEGREVATESAVVPVSVSDRARRGGRLPSAARRVGTPGSCRRCFGLGRGPDQDAQRRGSASACAAVALRNTPMPPASASATVAPLARPWTMLSLAPRPRDDCGSPSASSRTGGRA